MPASVGGIEVVEVVTRYGAKHLAIKHRHDDAMSRYFTACMGTSSWTIESWAANPDHPLGLTADEMVGLDLCSRCVAILRPVPVQVDEDQVQAALDRATGADFPDTPATRVARAITDRRVLAAEVLRLRVLLKAKG